MFGQNQKYHCIKFRVGFPTLALLINVGLNKVSTLELHQTPLI